MRTAHSSTADAARDKRLCVLAYQVERGKCKRLFVRIALLDVVLIHLIDLVLVSGDKNIRRPVEPVCDNLLRTLSDK